MKFMARRHLLSAGAAVGVAASSLLVAASPASADYWTETQKQWVADQKGNGTIAVQYQGGGRWKGHITARDTKSNGTPIEVSVKTQYYSRDLAGNNVWSSGGGVSVETVQGQGEATKYFDLTAGQYDSDTERVRLSVITCENDWVRKTCTNRWYAVERKL